MSHIVTIFLKGGQTVRMRLKSVTVNTSTEDGRITSLKWVRHWADPSRILDIQLDQIAMIITRKSIFP